VESTPKLLFIAVMKKRLAGCNGEHLLADSSGKAHQNFFSFLILTDEIDHLCSSQFKLQSFSSGA
jgi:hypothetical protein